MNSAVWFAPVTAFVLVSACAPDALDDSTDRDDQDAEDSSVDGSIVDPAEGTGGADSDTPPTAMAGADGDDSGSSSGGSLASSGGGSSDEGSGGTGEPGYSNYDNDPRWVTTAPEACDAGLGTHLINATGAGFLNSCIFYSAEGTVDVTASFDGIACASRTGGEKTLIQQVLRNPLSGSQDGLTITVSTDTIYPHFVAVDTSGRAWSYTTTVKVAADWIGDTISYGVFWTQLKDGGDTYDGTPIAWIGLEMSTEEEICMGAIKEADL